MTSVNAGKLVIDNSLPATNLQAISGAGELVVAGSTNLTATSINVGTLTITSSHGPFAAAAVPEPGSFVLLLMAAAALAGWQLPLQVAFDISEILRFAGHSRQSAVLPDFLERLFNIAISAIKLLESCRNEVSNTGWPHWAEPRPRRKTSLLPL